MMRWWQAVLMICLVTLSGCLAGDPDGEDPGPDAPGPDEPDPGNATFEAFVVEPAVHQGHGLYEPTIDVSPEGAIYISAHSTGVGVAPAPAYVSTDDGRTWQNMALAGPGQYPLQGQTAGPLFSDEIFIVAGDDGTAWGVDINLRDYIVAGWCGQGAELCYYNPQAYDHAEAQNEQNDCTPLPIKDRPWAAYRNGSLFMVNNPGGGPAQIAVMDVPPAVPVDAGPAVSDIQWNLCADSGGGIPGIPDLREDGFFAMAHSQPGGYIVTTGHVDDIHTTQEHWVFNNSHSAPHESDSTASQIGNYGMAAFEADGDLWFAAMNNTVGSHRGGIHLAHSTDDGETFQDLIFRRDNPVSSIYVDGNRFGEGLLVHWGEVDGAATDWYFAHAFADNGTIEVRNVMLAFDDGPEASRHVQGAALGPDGRGYMVMSDVSGNDDAAMAVAAGTTPLRVVVQQDGPVLPVGA